MCVANWGCGDGSGVMVTPVEEITVQNYDMQFGTNVIGTCGAVDRSVHDASLT
jgi:hypothetical protein